MAEAQSAAVEAQAAKVSGKVLLAGNGRTPRPLLAGTVLAPGDEIDTRGGGRVSLELSDGSLVLVRPRTVLILQDYRQAGSLRELLKIVLGRVRVKINHFGGRPNPYRVNSPSASIGIRGTEFSVSVNAAGDTEVSVWEGLVEVISLSRPAQKVLVEPGRGVIVRPNADILFFTPTDEGEGRDGDEPNPDNDAQNSSGPGKDAPNSANRINERALDRILDSGETIAPARFAAFADNFFDSLENPAYATEFTAPEGRIFFLPSFGGVRDGAERRPFLGLGALHPVDYGLSPQVTFFTPLARGRASVGGSLTFSRSGFQSFILDGNAALSSPPFPLGATGRQASLGATRNDFFNASFVAARKFGRASLGVGLDFTRATGAVREAASQTDGGGVTVRSDLLTRSTANRTRLTTGLRLEAGRWGKIGLFYRYGFTNGGNRDILHSIGNSGQPLGADAGNGRASEIGWRWRGALTRRLFFGAEGSLLWARNTELKKRPALVEATERTRPTLATLGWGLGYAFKPRTVFSFDVTGGLSRIKTWRREDATGNLLESERERTRFVAFHAALQTDIWRQAFISASILSLTQSRTTDLTLLPDRFGRRLNTDGMFVPDGRARLRFTDLSSNFGVGWRFSPNFLVQYILSTDYGQNAPRHTLLLRYTFNIGGK